MRAYLIDPTKASISKVEYDGDHKSIYSFIEADLFDCAEFANTGDTVFVDDEGVINGNWHAHGGFTINGLGPYAGLGLVLGYDPYTGDSIAAQSSLPQIRGMVEFLSPAQFAEYAEDV
jgi:hypothetical protein